MYDAPPISASSQRIACVSFLNSKPLIEPLLARPDVAIHFAVPSALLPLMDAGVCSAGLLSIVDYHAAAHDMLLVPAGAIACDGPTLTVRIFSRVPPEQITTLHADTDSHTSVLLAQVLLRECFQVVPQVIPLKPAEGVGGAGSELPVGSGSSSAALLLIGDKVVTAAPSAALYPYQLDLGEQWKKLTGLPFVFACWMMRADTPPVAARELAKLLAWAQRQGATMTEQLLDKYAAEKHWPRDLARRYFTEYLRYELSPRARLGIERFFELTVRHGLLGELRPLRYFEFATAV